MGYKRVNELCDKLYNPKNTVCREHMAKWMKDSSEWANDRVSSSTRDFCILRLRYVLNHLCSSLVHLLPKPEYGYDPCGIINDMLRMHYTFENSQACVVDGKGNVLIVGVDYCFESWAFLVCAVYPLVGMGKSLEDYLRENFVSKDSFEDAEEIADWYTKVYANLEN